MPFRIHFDAVSPDDLKDKSNIVNIARPFLGVEPRPVLQERYKEFWDKFDPDASMESADIAVLPMSWNYYLKTDQLARAEAFVARADAAGKPCVAYGMGDYMPRIRVKPVHVFGVSLYRSRSVRNPQHALPALFPDELTIQSLDDLPVRQKGKKPVVGFCGQATTDLSQVGHLLALNTLANVSELLGRAKYEAPTWMPHLFLRNRVLKLVGESAKVKTNFLIRDRYQGKTRSVGTSATDVRREFLQNIADSDYTICVRGSGNYSKRFYEVLNLGRIPVFINTDCILPFENQIDWKKYCVWVEQDEIGQIGDKIAEFHDRLSDAEFVDLQRSCRQLWQDWLTERSSVLNFPRHFS